MRMTRKLWLKVVQETYPNVLRPIAGQVKVDKIIAKKRGTVAPVKAA